VRGSQQKCRNAMAQRISKGGGSGLGGSEKSVEGLGEGKIDKLTKVPIETMSKNKKHPSTGKGEIIRESSKLDGPGVRNIEEGAVATSRERGVLLSGKRG